MFALRNFIKNEINLIYKNLNLGKPEKYFWRGQEWFMSHLTVLSHDAMAWTNSKSWKIRQYPTEGYIMAIG